MTALPVPPDGFPIPVAPGDFTGEACTTLACEKCGVTRQADPDEIGMTDGLGACPNRCGGYMTWAFDAADRCGGCGQLGWFPSTLNHCCSRVCMLQAEYAKRLEAGRS